MSYSVIIGTCNDQRNKVSKTLNGEHTYTCTPKFPCDVLHPTLKIAGTVDSGNMFSFNGRKYYITGMAIDNGCTYITGTVDALSSWSSSIIGTSQYVSRSETDFNLSIPDNLLPLAIENLPHTEKAGAFGVSSEYIILGVTNYDYKPKYNIQVNHEDTQDEEHPY